MKRVMVVGSSGSGKTTFAAALSNITGLPVFHTDQILLKPGWTERDPDERKAMMAEVEAKPRWIIEGGLSESYASRAARADTAIWFDLPLTLRLTRVLKRRFEYHGKSRADLPENCPERLNPKFLAYVIRTRNSFNETIAQAIAEAPHLKTHRIRTAKGARTFLDWTRRDYETDN